MDNHAEAAELPLDDAGTRLRRAREAAGLSRKQVAETTKIPERHLRAIEEGNFSALPARTYAIGFSRSFARLVGADEGEIVALVREELAATDPNAARRVAPAFEPGDPARVPSSRFAWLSALAAVVAIVAGFAFWRGYYAPGGELPSILPNETPSAVAAAAAPALQPAPTGPVVFTALAPSVWVKFTDAAGNQLFQKELAQGETYTVPADRPQVFLRTAHPEALGITVDGQPVARLAQTQRTLGDVDVSAAGLMARGTPATSPVGAPVPARATAPGLTRPGATGTASSATPPSALPTTGRGSLAAPSSTSAAVPSPAVPSPAATKPPGAAD